MDSQRTFTQEQARMMYEALQVMASWDIEYLYLDLHEGYDGKAREDFQRCKATLAAIDTTQDPDADDTPPGERYVVRVNPENRLHIQLWDTFEHVEIGSGLYSLTDGSKEQGRLYKRELASLEAEARRLNGGL